MSEVQQFDVNLSQPRKQRVVLSIVMALIIIGVVIAAALAIANRSASPTANSTMKVMPANTLMFASLHTQPDKLPNFNVIAEAWKGSKEAKQIESGLELALMQTGFNWEDDIRPWLGERISLGLIDVGSVQPAAAGALPSSSSLPQMQLPGIIVAAQTIDRVKSDAFLANLRKELEKQADNPYATVTVQGDTYRGIPVVYLKSTSSGDARLPGPTVEPAYATVNDTIVFALSYDTLKKAIDASIDGTNLTQSTNFNNTMGALPAEHLAAYYIDIPAYVKATAQQAAAQKDLMNDFLKDMPDSSKQMYEQMLKDQEVRQQAMVETAKAVGGMGVTMSYEPSGVRFDTALQIEPSRLPETQRQLYEANLKPISGKIPETAPASTFVLLNSKNLAGVLKPLFDPALPNPYNLFSGSNMALSSLLARDDMTQPLKEFQQRLGLDLNADVIGLLDGEYAVTLMSKPKEQSDARPGSLNPPLEFALLFESSDVNRLAANVDKVLQAALAEAPGTTTLQKTDRGYTALIERGDPVLAYGVIDGRFVIGTSPDTLAAIDDAAQAPLTADATYKSATSVLPDARTNIGYLNFAPMWQMMAEGMGTQPCIPCNYLKPFKWLSYADEAPSNGIQRGTVHIGIEAAK
jgi:hypothetical protein